MNISAEDLQKLVAGVLLGAGATPGNAEYVASHLVEANLCGVDTHGVWQLPGYVNAIDREELLPQSEPVVMKDALASALVSGNWGFGQVAAREAAWHAFSKAQRSGIALVSIVQCHHLGRMGSYVEEGARKGLITMMWASGLGEIKPVVVPFGGSTSVFGTNPIALGFPTPDCVPIVIDFATSAVSAVKVLEAKRKRQPVPPAWIVDRQGVSTTDPTGFAEFGGLLPFGAHKGFALMVATEILGRIISGADAYVQPPRGGDPFGHQGATIVAFKPDLFQPMDDYLRLTKKLREKIRRVPPAPGVARVSVPGDPESQVKSVRTRQGIPIPRALRDKLDELSRRPAAASSAPTNV